jgi:hypothetical protein
VFIVGTCPVSIYYVPVDSKYSTSASYVSGVLGSSGSGSGSSIMIDDNYPTFVSFVLLLNV